MIDYDRINEYVATMLSKSWSCYRLTDIALDDLMGAKIRLYQKRICMMELNT